MKWTTFAAILLLLAGCDLFGGDNRAPEFTTTPDTLATVGEEYEYLANARDADNDDVSIELVQAPLWLSAEDAEGHNLIVRGTPARGHAGPQTIELRASDGKESTFQTFTLRVGYDFAGAYWAASFTYFEAGCGDTYDALEQGGYFSIDVDPFGRFEAGWEPGLRAAPITSTFFEGTYSVSGDVLTLENIDDETAASIWNDTELRIEPPRLRQTSTNPCGARVTFEMID